MSLRSRPGLGGIRCNASGPHGWTIAGTRGRAVVACLLGLAPTLAPGAAGSVDTLTTTTATTTTTWVHAALLHLPYASSERLGSVVLNRERGDLVGAQVQLGMGLQAGTFTLDLQHASGRLGYTGLTQFGLPLTTQTRLSLDRVGLAASPTWPRLLLAEGALTTQVGVQQLRIDRRIEPTARSAGLDEQLRLDLLTAGLRWRQPLVAQTWIHLGLDWRQPVGAALRVDAGNVVDRYTLRPRHRGWPAADLTLQRTLRGGLSASLGLHLEQPEIGSSPPLAITQQGHPVGVSSYPGSRQRWHSLSIGLDWRH